jgi:hypothetical protein
MKGDFIILIDSNDLQFGKIVNRKQLCNHLLGEMSNTFLSDQKFNRKGRQVTAQRTQSFAL